jgi:MFS family permease
MEEKEISQSESLLLIRQMIQTAKKEQRDDGRGWIIWGWMLFLASVLTVLNLRWNWFADTFLFWNLFGLIAFVLLAWDSIRYLFFKKTERVRTYTGDLFSRLNVGFFVSLLFIIVAINVGSRSIYHQLGYFDGSFVRIGFGLLINLYAFWILIYGTALNFRPSVVCAYICWGIGFGTMFVKTFEQVMLFHALAALIGYIIPGYLANKEFKRIKREEKAVERV